MGKVIRGPQISVALRFVRVLFPIGNVIDRGVFRCGPLNSGHPHLKPIPGHAGNLTASTHALICSIPGPLE